MATWFEKLDRLREEFAVIDDLDVALEVWGLTPARFAALSSGAMFGLFVLLGWGFAWGVFAAVLTFPAVLVGLLAIQEAREKMRQPPDYDRWSKVDVFAIWMAASLWAERIPTPVITPSSKIYPYLQQLKAAAEANTLRTRGDDPETGMKATVTREELQRYAESIGETPRFLFPDS